MDIPWIIKYAPKNSSEIINQTEAINRIKNFIINYKKEKVKALLLYGPPGVGKTSSIHAIANELNYEIVELNASDARSAYAINKFYKEVSKTVPFFRKGRIILIDEMDGLAGFQDKGGIGAIRKIIEDSKWPIILTANDPWDPKLRLIRNICEMVEFKKLTTTQIYVALKKIVEKEKINNISDEILKKLAEREDGDLRSAINDLQILANRKGEIKIADLNSLGNREREQSIFMALAVMFKANTILGSSTIFNDVDMDPEQIQAWIEENIPEEYEKIDEIYKAYDWMSKATMFRSRIYERQYWELLKYYTTLMYAGVALAKHEKYKKFTRYKMPKYIRVLSQTKDIRDKINQNLEKFRKKVHASKKRIREVYINTAFGLLNLDEKAAKKYLEILGIEGIEELLDKLKDASNEKI